MIDIQFMAETFGALAAGVPLTLRLAVSAVCLGAMLALLITWMRLCGITPLSWSAQLYVFLFRSTPLLVQIFLIYYGLGQFPEIRASFLWPFLREPYWCAVLALTLNTAAYASEIFRGGFLSVPHGQVEAARAAGMGPWLLCRRIMLPLAIRQALPGYGNEIVLMVKATSLASTITLMEITGIAAKLISETYRAVEVFVVAGVIYLAINFVVTRLVQIAEYRLSPHLRQAPSLVIGAVAGREGTA